MIAIIGLRVNGGLVMVTVVPTMRPNIARLNVSVTPLARPSMLAVVMLQISLETVRLVQPVNVAPIDGKPPSGVLAVASVVRIRQSSIVPLNVLTKPPIRRFILADVTRQLSHPIVKVVPPVFVALIAGKPASGVPVVGFVVPIWQSKLVQSNV